MVYFLAKKKKNVHTSICLMEEEYKKEIIMIKARETDTFLKVKQKKFYRDYSSQCFFNKLKLLSYKKKIKRDQTKKKKSHKIYHLFGYVSKVFSVFEKNLCKIIKLDKFY